MCSINDHRAYTMHMCIQLLQISSPPVCAHESTPDSPHPWDNGQYSDGHYPNSAATCDRCFSVLPFMLPPSHTQPPASLRWDPVPYCTQPLVPPAPSREGPGAFCVRPLARSVCVVVWLGGGVTCVTVQIPACWHAPKHFHISRTVGSTHSSRFSAT